MNGRWRILSCLVVCGCLSLLSGCASVLPGGDDDADTVQTITQDGETIRIYFPACFFIEGARLNDHGRMPNTTLFGAGITMDAPLDDVYREYNDILTAQRWTVDREERARQSFRIMASLAGDTIEIRAVQGSAGPTQVFLLYAPQLD